ncbi:MAG: hypothetical protein P1V97_09110, partial [Planctomycetota bacterium]|nr:hypothetical protein [Planctomycetota bacterium]
ARGGSIKSENAPTSRPAPTLNRPEDRKDQAQREDPRPSAPVNQTREKSEQAPAPVKAPAKKKRQPSTAPMSGGHANMNALRSLEAFWEQWKQSEKDLAVVKALEKGVPLSVSENEEKFLVSLEFRGLPAFLQSELEKDEKKLVFEDRIADHLKKPCSLLFRFVAGKKGESKLGNSPASEYPIVDFAQKSLHSRPMHGRNRRKP